MDIQTDGSLHRCLLTLGNGSAGVLAVFSEPFSEPPELPRDRSPGNQHSIPGQEGEQEEQGHRKRPMGLEVTTLLGIFDPGWLGAGDPLPPSR